MPCGSKFLQKAKFYNLYLKISLLKMGRFNHITSLYNILKFSTRPRCIKPCLSVCGRPQKLTLRDFHSTKIHGGINENISVNEASISEKAVVVEPIPHEVLVDKLLKCSSLSDQMSMLSSTLSLCQEDIDQRFLVAQQVKNMLSPFLENFDVKIFGSSVNGFGFKGCDIDMVIVSNVKPEEMRKNVFDDSNIPKIEDILNGKVSRSYMDHLSSHDQLLFIHSVFLDFYKDSEMAPIFISLGQVPIVRFNHDPTNLKVDLTCRNNYGIINSKLLNAFRLYDCRVGPFIMTIRYWAKHVGLIGKGLMFNSYCLTLLAIYFLQTRKLPILPTIEYVFSVAGEEINSIDFTEESCYKIVETIPPTENTQSLGELLREFFFYYMYFDFKNVICPSNASTKSREELAHGAEAKKFKFNTICVQDPINPIHNVANLVDYKHCRKFAKEMLSVSQLFRDKKYMTPGGQNWGLTALFDRPEDLWFSYPNKQTIENNTEIEIFSSFPGKLTISTATETTHLVRKILKDILLFECSVPQESVQHRLTDSLDSSVEQFSERNESQALMQMFKCSGHTNTWLGRECIKVEKHLSDDFLSMERDISLELYRRKDKNYSFAFMCKFYSVKREQDLELLVKLQSLTNKPINPILTTFLQEYLPKTLNKLR